MFARCDLRRRQGGLPAVAHLPNTDHRKGGPNVDGRVILYADNLTGSLEYAINETDHASQKTN